jgi:leucine-rich repeat kinase 1
MCNIIFPPLSSLFQALMFLRLQGNQLLSLPPQEKWTCTQLKTLDLSRNQLGK